MRIEIIIDAPDKFSILIESGAMTNGDRRPPIPPPPSFKVIMEWASLQIEEHLDQINNGGAVRLRYQVKDNKIESVKYTFAKTDSAAPELGQLTQMFGPNISQA